jgi:tRNA pseudouridine13 synthase
LKSLSTSNWQYLHGEPEFCGVIKQQADDFVVDEQLGFELTGEGEHHVLWVEKINTNTAYVAEQLSAFSGIPLRDIAYAGRKDKFARTRQYFSIYQGKHEAPNWDDFACANVKILTATRHNKKFRLGALAGNKFTLTIRDVHVQDVSQLQARIEAVSEFGVPNYYGQQRFGEMHTASGIKLNGNLELALRMTQGEKIKNRNKRSMAISALRSWLFNEMLSYRIEQQQHRRIMTGDALQLSGSNSYFVVTREDDMVTLQQRLLDKDVQLTAPLFGDGKTAVTDQAQEFEANGSQAYAKMIKTLAGLGLKQERRPIILYPRDLDYQYIDSALTLSFSLPGGCFATSVLREIVNTNQQS